jgi:hypothetical protein
MPDNFHTKECATRHGGDTCDCGYELRACLNKLDRLSKDIVKEVNHLEEIRKREKPHG